MLEVRVLGGLSALVDGRPVELPADARARELLARLALSPGPQPRSVLAGRLRPDVPEESARKTLRNALYELRRALGPAAQDALVVTGQHVALADAVRVDVREFRRHLGGDRLEAAAGLGGAALLEGIDGDWALRAREEHAAELAGVLATLAARAEESGDPAAAVAWARRRVEIEPLAEAAHRELIRLLAMAGDRPAALAAARAMTDRLRSELGLPPSAATRALVEDVRRGRIDAAGAAPATAPALPAALAGAARPEGREPALARLEQAWAEVVAGGRRFALVTGEPGIGKTTLAAELARRVHAHGAAVLLGRSDEHALVPFQPWIEALERLLEALPPAAADHWLTAHDGALARLLPARSAAPDGGQGGPRERYLAFELVRALLGDVGGRWPVLLVLDDVHWADADSLSLLRHLARAASPGRLLAVLCARAHELEPPIAQTLADLRREGPLVHVDLAGLDDKAVAALLARRTGAADAEAARRLRARSGGNPFFVGELLREAEERGDAAAGPPAGVRDVLARRLERLEPATLGALEVAALGGVEFDVATLAGVDGRPVVAVLEALDGAIEAGLVAPADRAGRYAFAHALVPETIVAALPASRRSRLNLQVADVLAGRHESGEAGAGDVARHLRAAGALAGAELVARWELAAAREASAALAHADAAAHYEAALAAEAEPQRCEILLALGDAHDRAGHTGPARAAFTQAAAVARAAGEADQLARAALGYGGTSVVIAPADPEIVRLLEEALAAAPGDEPALAARLLARLSTELYYADAARARELSDRAVAAARRAGDPAALAAALNAARVALWSPAFADARLAVASEMLAAAEAAGDREAMLQARNWRVVDLVELGRVPEAAAEIDAYERLADAVALPHFRWYVPLWRATLAMLGGRWAEAGELGEQALALARQADDPNGPLFVAIQRHQGFHDQGRIDQMDRERIVRGAAASPAAATGWLGALVLFDANTGAHDEARRVLTDLTRDNCRALAMDANWHGACVLAQAAVLLADREAAAALHALLAPHARLFPVIARAVSCLGSAEYFVGGLAALLGRHDEAEARLRRAVAENDRIGAGPAAAGALLRLGTTLAATGREDEARDTLGQAADRAAAMGLETVVADARRLLGD